MTGSSSKANKLLSTLSSQGSLNQLLPTLVAALISGIITIVISISFAGLVFGSSDEFLARGIGLTLSGAIIIRLIVTVTSSYPGVIATPQDVPVAILPIVMVSIFGGLASSATAEEQFLTMIAILISSAVLTGLLFLLIGLFKLGDFVRFLPYPVIGGFLAGTGWLLAIGGLGMMAGFSVDLNSVPMLFEPDILWRWLSGLIFALLLLVAIRRFNNPFLLPGFILVGLVLFFIVLWLSKIPLSQLSDQGWLMGPFPEGRLFQPINPFAIYQANWSLLLGEAGNLVTIVVVSLVALLLNASALELILEKDIDLNRELVAAGLGNFGTALTGGIVGFHSLSLSTLGHKMGGKGTRAISFLSAIFMALILIFGASVIAALPRMVLGGIVTFLGLSLFIEWVYEAWFKFSRVDYAIIVIILGYIAAIGFLEGVALGLGLAVILFVINYSRINVVKHALTGLHFSSRVTRSEKERKILKEVGDELYILQLHGYIFFGTANNLLNQVRERIEDPNLKPVRFIVLDFRRVTGLDSTAVLSFSKMKQLTTAHQVHLVLSNPGPKDDDIGQDRSVPRILIDLVSGTQPGSQSMIHLFRDLDHALEWCENLLLEAAGYEMDGEEESLIHHLRTLMPEAENLETVIQYFERLEVAPDYFLMKQGEEPNHMYIIESGQITAQLEIENHEPIRLESMGGGRVVGEIGFYLNQPRTASVVTIKPSVLYRLSLDSLTKMEEEDPKAARDLPPRYELFAFRTIIPSRRYGFRLTALSTLIKTEGCE